MLQFGAVAVDIKNNKVYGDAKVVDGTFTQHYTKEDMAESALALVETAPEGATAVAKDYDGQCYFYGPRRLDKVKVPAPKAEPRVLASHRRSLHYLYLGNKFTPECYDKQFATVY
jgi:hypothetical protein